MVIYSENKRERERELFSIHGLKRGMKNQK